MPRLATLRVPPASSATASTESKDRPAGRPAAHLFPTPAAPRSHRVARDSLAGVCHWGVAYYTKEPRPRCRRQCDFCGGPSPAYYTRPIAPPTLISSRLAANPCGPVIRPPIACSHQPFALPFVPLPQITSRCHCCFTSSLTVDTSTRRRLCGRAPKASRALQATHRSSINMQLVRLAGAIAAAVAVNAQDNRATTAYTTTAPMTSETAAPKTHTIGVAAVSL